MTAITIALDAMGGDCGPPVVVQAGLHVLQKQPEVSLLLFGKETEINPILQKHPAYASLQSRITLEHTDEIVEMDCDLNTALRQRKRSSMRLAVQAVKEGRAQACVSAGNTGALMAISRFVLKTVAGVDRPALIVEMPTVPIAAPRASVHMLDLGANVDCTPENLTQFALMANSLVRFTNNNPNPTIALLNVGHEEIKGSEAVRLAHQRLSQMNLNYIGFVEGDQIMTGLADIIVCDGFVGNIALKHMEGIVKQLSSRVKSSLMASWRGKLGALILAPIFKRLRKTMDPNQYNGASLLGLNGVVVKSHGSADTQAFAHAIEHAIIEGQRNLPDVIRNAINTGTQESSE